MKKLFFSMLLAFSHIQPLRKMKRLYLTTSTKNAMKNKAKLPATFRLCTFFKPLSTLPTPH